MLDSSQQPLVTNHEYFGVKCPNPTMLYISQFTNIKKYVSFKHIQTRDKEEIFYYEGGETLE